ncbi:MAG TPA: phosphatidate cytidylyltransferase [Chthonomonadaceae bacterium]|nr:phosphatidate cytidylyltransferase [Chthonomonadaceae bacterium]
MFRRLISAFIGISIFLLTCFGGQLAYTIAVLVVAGLGVAEFVKAQQQSRLEAQELPEPIRDGYGRFGWLNPLIAWSGLALPMVAYLLCIPNPWWRTPLALACGLIVLALAPVVFRAAYAGRALGRFRAGYGPFGFIYIGALFSSFVLLRGMPGRLAVPPFGEADYGAWVMLYVAVSVWATDTFAYFVGRTLGRHKLNQTLSPGKTVEGAIGGLVGGVLVGVAFGKWIHLPLQHGLVVGALAAIFGQLGDLFESALKRELNIKDFGNVLPGHGGSLDRFDSLLFVAPLAYLYLHFVVGL